MLREGVKIALVGVANVGKSSLINALSRRPVAIVTEIAGTTTDMIHSHLDIGGYPVQLVDTAGVRSDANSVVEREGIQRALHAARIADILLVVADVNCFDTSGNDVKSQIDNYLRSLQLDLKSPRKKILVFNKCDALKDGELSFLKTAISRIEPPLASAFISCVTEQGFEEFLNSLTSHLRELCSHETESGGSVSSEREICVNARHVHQLKRCVDELDEAFALLNCKDVEKSVVFVAERLRNAANAIGIITGAVPSADTILDTLFKEFCIGK